MSAQGPLQLFKVKGAVAKRSDGGKVSDKLPGNHRQPQPSILGLFSRLRERIVGTRGISSAAYEILLFGSSALSLREDFDESPPGKEEEPLLHTRNEQRLDAIALAMRRASDFDRANSLEALSEQLPSLGVISSGRLSGDRAIPLTAHAEVMALLLELSDGNTPSDALGPASIKCLHQLHDKALLGKQLPTGKTSAPYINLRSFFDTRTYSYTNTPAGISSSDAFSAPVKSNQEQHDTSSQLLPVLPRSSYSSRAPPASCDTPVLVQIVWACRQSCEPSLLG